MAVTREAVSSFARLARLIAPLGLDEFLRDYYDQQAAGQRIAIRVVLTVEGAHRNNAGFVATQEVYNLNDARQLCSCHTSSNSLSEVRTPNPKHVRAHLRKEKCHEPS